jgi:peptide/nickel transport system substrate-binding protein
MKSALHRAATAAAALAIATALAACGSSSSSGTGASGEDVELGAWGGVINPGGTPVEGGTLTIDQAGTPEGISPIFFQSQPTNLTMQVVMATCDQLVEYMPGKVDPQPALAKSWDVSADGKTMTFHLRDATYSNGMPVTAADAKYVLDRIRGPESFASGLFTAVESIAAPDPKTVVIKLSQPAPGMLFNLATGGASLVPAKLVAEEGEDAFNQHPVCSGPFKLERWAKNQEVVLTRNDRYWRQPEPYLDRVVMRSTASDNTRVLNVKSGTSDVADYVPFAQIAELEGSGDVQVLVAPGGDMNVVWINNSKEPLDEVGVRRALNYASPIDSIIKVVFAGDAPRMNTVIPKTKYWTDKAKAYPYDLEKAKEELAKTSVPDGFSTELLITGSDEPSEEIAQILQQSWAKVGIKAKIAVVDDAVRSERYQSGDYELTLSRPGEFTTDVPVDDEFAQLMFDSPETHNLFTWYRNPKTKQLSEEAGVELDEQRRAQLFEEMHVESMLDPPVVPIVYTPNRAAVQSSVHDLVYMLGGFWRLEDTWKSKE